MGWLFCGLPCAHDEIGSRFCFKSNISVVTYKLNFRPQIWPLRSYFYSISIIIEHNPIGMEDNWGNVSKSQEGILLATKCFFFFLPKTRHTAMCVPLQQIKMIVVHDGHCCMCQFFLVSFSFYRRFIMNLERMYLGAVDCQEALVTCILELYVWSMHLPVYTCT